MCRTFDKHFSLLFAATPYLDPKIQYHEIRTFPFCLSIVEFKDFSRLLDCFPVLFKTDLIINFSRKPSKFKYFSSLCKPCPELQNNTEAGFQCIREMSEN